MIHDETASERRERGQDLRRAVPRSAHADWTPHAERAEPVAAILAAEAGRLAALLPLRHARMARDAAAYFQGAAGVMAADLDRLPRSGLRVLVCGDAHLGNFGILATAEATPAFDVVDFDEACTAPFEWDLKRLAVSLVLAGHVGGLSPPAMRALGRRAAHGYRRQIASLAELSPLEAWRHRLDIARLIEDIPDRDVRRRERQLLVETLQDGRHAYGRLAAHGGRPRLPAQPPAIFRLEQHEATAHAAFAAYLDAAQPEQRALLERYRLRDVAFKATGVGGVGRFCAIGLFASGDDDVLLLQATQAGPSVLEPFAGPSLFAAAGERVVAAQRTMQAAPDRLLGWTKQPVDGRSFHVRTLADPRLSASGGRVEPDALRFHSLVCARALARAHVLSGDAAMIAGYLGEGEAFDEAIAEFAVAYAAQVGRDFAMWQAAVRRGEIEVAA